MGLGDLSLIENRHWQRIYKRRALAKWLFANLSWEENMNNLLEEGNLKKNSLIQPKGLDV